MVQKKRQQNFLTKQIMEDLKSPAGFSNNFLVSMVAVSMLGIGLLGGYIMWGQQSINRDASNDATVVLPEPTMVEGSLVQKSTATSDWKTFYSEGITLKYPANWVTPENAFISEKTFVPGEQDRNVVYNIVGIQKYSNPMYVGSTNSQLFSKINNSTSPLVDQREIRTKLTSGTVASGEEYVIFTSEASPTASEYYKKVKAYILKGETIFELSLTSYDEGGLEIFKQVVISGYIE